MENHRTGAVTPRTQQIQGLLWKLKKSITGSKWRKKFIQADNAKLVQWHTEAKPVAGARPKHTFQLSRCIVKEVRGPRPYAFSVTDRTSNDSITLAAESVTEYAAWLAVLLNEDVHGSEDGKDETATSAMSGYQDMRPTGVDMIVEFFFVHNEATNAKHHEISVSRCHKLMQLLELPYSGAEATQVLQDILQPTGRVRMEDFRNLYLRLTAPNEQVATRKPKELVGRQAKPKQSAVDSSRQYGYILTCATYLTMNRPSWHDFPDPDLLCGVFDVVNVYRHKCHSAIASLRGKTLSSSAARRGVIDRWEDSETAVPVNWNDSYQALTERASLITSQMEEDDMEMFYSLNALYGRFLASAVNGIITFCGVARNGLGAQIVIEEYSLPMKLRKAQCISIDQESSADEGRDLVFHYNGLLFRILATPACDRDRDLGELRCNEVHHMDELLHKMGGNECRALHVVRNALLSINSKREEKNSENGTVDAASDRRSSQDSDIFRGSSQDYDDEDIENEKLVRPCTMLMTLVDYCGFRVQVFSPVNIEEQLTLVHGFSSDKLFVNAMAAVNPVLPAIAKHTNLSTTRTTTLVCSVPLEQKQKSYLSNGLCEIITKEMQFHWCEDQRLYLINFSNFFPPDLPRRDTTDILHRQLRPEFVRHYSSALSPEALRYESAEGMSPEPDEGKRSSPQLGAGSSRADSNILAALTHLHTTHMLHVVRQLDNLVSLPLDSYGLTQFLHNAGINMRYLGRLYSLSRMPHVKDMILCEAVARCCKFLLNETLRNASRRARAESLMAEQRKRSKLANFIEHQNSLLQRKRDAIIDIFNLVLGSGEDTNDFWSGLLPQVLSAKFDLTLTTEKHMLHPRQLFEAMQHHMCAAFDNAVEYALFSEECPNPFQEYHFTDYFSKVKHHVLFPGYLSTVSHFADSLLAARLYLDAANAYRLHLSAFQIAHQSMTRLSSATKLHKAHIMYKLAVCMYCLGDTDTAAAVVRGALVDLSRGTPFIIRLLLLLMKIESKADRLPQAIVLYEQCYEYIIFSLGDRHPALLMLYSSLADIYYERNAFAHATVLVLMGIQFSKRTLGDMHMATAACVYKLAVLLLLEKRYDDAKVQLEHALDAYRRYADHGADVSIEISQCLHGLAIIYNALNDTSAAIEHCCLSISAACEKDRFVSPGVVSCFFLLTELYIKCYEISTAISIYEDIWKVITTCPTDYKDGSHVLVQTTALIISAQLSMLPLHVRTLLYATADDIVKPTIREWNIACGLVAKKCMEASSPVEFITTLVNTIVEKATSGADKNSLSMSVNRKIASSWKQSMVGVPITNKSENVSTMRPATDPNQQSIEDGAGSGKEIPAEHQIAVVLKLIELVLSDVS